MLSALTRRGQDVVNTFSGLDERLVTPPGSFSVMRNMSDRFYPAIATRAPRGASQTSLAKPHGLLWKNGLFWVDGTECYYKGNLISGLTVTDSDKQLVGMGAYIVIFPDKKVYNTHTGEVRDMDATYTQSGTITFEELSMDSVFTKITASGIGSTFKLNDGVTFYGVNDASFQVDGKPATKTITEIGANYIVVTAPLQNQISGTVELLASGSATRINYEGIQSQFSVGDVVRVIGCTDDALNGTGKTVTGKGTNYITIGTAFPTKTYSQSGTISAAPYFAGSSLTRITASSLGTTFSVGDVVTVAGFTGGLAALNGTKTIQYAGSGYLVFEGAISTSTTQSSGVTITRTRHKSSAVTVKRTSFTRASGITMKRESQTFDYVCEHDNRLWACSSANHEVYASALGDPTNWNTYEGLSTDSYTASVGSDGDFTGCISHMGQVLFMKEQSIHVMYGQKPANYQISTRQMPGVRKGCSRSMQIIDETLYYVGRKGVYAYDGAAPAKISEQIQSELSDAVAGQQDGRYYLSCKKDGKQALLTFDPRYQIWDQEDETKFLFSSYGDGILHYIDGDSKELRTITGSEDDDIAWCMESGDISENSLDQKHIGRVRFQFQMDRDAEATVYLRYDDDLLWEKKGTVRSSRKTVFVLPVIPRRCFKFRWRIEGHGQVKLLAMDTTVEGGSEIHGDIQSWFRR